MGESSQNLGGLNKDAIMLNPIRMFSGEVRFRSWTLEVQSRPRSTRHGKGSSRASTVKCEEEKSREYMRLDDVVFVATNTLVNA